MTAKKQVLRIFNLLTLFVCLAAPAVAQTNLFYNPGFELSGGFQTDYSRIFDHHGVDHGQYAIDHNTEGYGIGNWGWPEVYGHGGSGRFMMVNGFSGSNNPNKVVWKQTVQVTPNTNYTFSCYVANLNREIQGQINPAKLQLKINGQNVGNQYNLPSDNNWHAWPNIPQWNSGNSTEAIVEIRDNYTGLHGLGDDFAIDDLSFVAEATYSVTANSDTWPLACYMTASEIPVLNNDVISPGIQNVSVQIVALPQHGDAYVLPDKKIEYTLTDASFTGTDQLKYRVGFTAQGIYDEAWVFIQAGQPPTVGGITAPPAICAGGSLGIDVPSVNPSGTGQWQKSTAQNGTYQAFDPTNIPLSMNGNWVRYSATNDCGEGHSNAVQITVTNGPSFTGQTPTVQPICAGQSLNLTPPAYNSNGSQVSNPGWVASSTENGDYTAFSLTNIPATYNGWYIRYKIEGSCGTVYSQPARQLTVNVAPSNVGMLVAPEAICAGDDLEVTAPTFDGTGTGAWEICQTQNGTYQPFNINNVPATYNNWYLHYKVSNDCGNALSNTVQIHVNDAPTVATLATPSAICAGGSFNLTTPTIQNNGATITNQGWQIAATQNGQYNAFNNSNITYSYNGYWLRYFAENDCGETYSASVQVTVNDIPEVGNITAPAGICAGESFNLTEPQVQWRHTNQGTGSWEIAPTSSGDFTALTNNNIPFSYNGYYIRYKAVNGCGTSYSTNVVQVTVFSTEDTFEEITACDTYVWNGVTCNQTGDYTAQVQNSNGCTITAHLHFILSDAYTETQTFTSCGSFTWLVNGQTYYSTQTDTYTVESGNPLVCDSIFTLDLTINNAPEITGSISAPTSVCSGNPINLVAPQYEMNHVEGGDAHWEYATSANGPFTSFDPSANTLGYGTYYLRYAVINSCDEAYSNVVSFDVDAVPEAQMQLSWLQVCEGNALDLPDVNVNWNNHNEGDRLAQWQMSPTENGTYAAIDPTMLLQMNHNGYWLRFIAQTTCGTDVVGPVQITVLSAENEYLEPETACDFYQLPSGEVITESQVVEYEVFEPCFHIVYQPVEISHSDYVVEPITSCHEEFEWHGRTFYHSDQMQYAWDTLTNANHCDSIVELNLSFDEYSSYTHTRTACDSYVWEMKPNITYTESTRDSIFVPAVGLDDCDTWYYLELTVGHNSVNDGGIMTECSGFVWHGVPYYADAVIYDTLQTPVTHCDSIITYQLNIIPTIETDTSIVSCQPIMWQGQYCEEEGNYQHTFTSLQGCDSIVTMHFSLSDEIFYQFDTISCSPFTWYEHECFNNDTTYTHTFQTPAGCDSTVMMHVNLNTPVNNVRFQNACDSITINGVFYGIPEGESTHTYRIIVDTLVGPNGCDSVLIVNLMLRASQSIGQISGNSHVYVATNFFSGIYRYEIDTTDIVSPITWSLSNPDWQVVDQDEVSCQIFVPTPGSGELIAHFNGNCGEMEHSFLINAGFYGVGDHDAIEANVYPNPTKGTVTVEAEGIESIRLTDMMGQVLNWREYDRSNTVILNLNGYAPSVYLLEIKTTEGMVKRRVVVSR